MVSIMNIGGRCSALLRHVIFDVANVGLEWRQPSEIHQSVVSAAVDIAGGVFSSAASHYPSKQLDVLVPHYRYRKALVAWGAEPQPHC